MNNNTQVSSILPHGARAIATGRGAQVNQTGRFEPLKIELDEEFQEESLRPPTKYFKDFSKTIISKNDSPDIPFEASINPYRGCEHGCIYCYARPTHEYLGLSPGIDFESNIYVKTDAAQILAKQLSAKSWKPQPLAISGVTDAYQPVEKKLALTRQCLSLLNFWSNPAIIITKNFLVTRDIDILSEMAQKKCVSVMISLTTLNDSLRKTMEPRTSSPILRLKAMEKLAGAGIPVGVLMGPVIPGLTDHEIPALLKAAKNAGAQRAGYIMLRLPHSVKDLFIDWLKKYYPQSEQKITHQIQSVRGGKLYDSDFSQRLKGSGLKARQIETLFDISCKNLGLTQSPTDLSIENFGKGCEPQQSLFDL